MLRTTRLQEYIQQARYTIACAQLVVNSVHGRSAAVVQEPYQPKVFFICIIDIAVASPAPPLLGAKLSSMTAWIS